MDSQRDQIISDLNTYVAEKVSNSDLPARHRPGVIAAAGKMITAKFDDMFAKGVSVDEIEQDLRGYIDKMVAESNRALKYMP